MYKAVIKTDQETKEYIGSCSTTFKLKYANHKSSLANKKKMNDTELSFHVWQLKDLNKNFRIDWQIITRTKSYQKGSKNCKLCLTEKMHILNSDKLKTINNRDLISKCLHKHKFNLKKVKVASS